MNYALSAFTLLVGWQEGHLACKNWVVGCWHGYLSGMRSRFAHTPADITATHCIMLWYWLTQVVLDKEPLNGCCNLQFTHSSSHNNITCSRNTNQSPASCSCCSLVKNDSIFTLSMLSSFLVSCTCCFSKFTSFHSDTLSLFLFSNIQHTADIHQHISAVKTGFPTNGFKSYQNLQLYVLNNNWCLCENDIP